MKHVVKIEDAHYENICAGRKTFEVRYNDRGYQTGDLLEFLEADGCFEREGAWMVNYVHSGYGLEKNFVILGIKRVKK